ncbi:MAG: hypothetical protein ACP5KF_00345, partial [Sulfurihydrogenibium sp.]
MNIYPSYVFDDASIDTQDLWTNYETWLDFDIKNNGLWFAGNTLENQSNLPFARVYYLEGNFKKGSVLQFPFPVYTKQTNYVKAFSHHNL